MNYKSKSVPVVAGRWHYNAVTEESANIKKFIEPKTVPIIDSRGMEVVWQLKDDYGNTRVNDGDWVVEFPNGEVHVLRPERFNERFEHVESYTPEEVKNAISMAKRWHEMGGETS